MIHVRFRAAQLGSFSKKCSRRTVGSVTIPTRAVPTSTRFEPTRVHSLDTYTHSNSLLPPSMFTALNFTSAVAPTKLSAKIAQSSSRKAVTHIVAVSHPLSILEPFSRLFREVTISKYPSSAETRVARTIRPLSTPPRLPIRRTIARSTQQGAKTILSLFRRAPARASVGTRTKPRILAPTTTFSTSRSWSRDTPT